MDAVIPGLSSEGYQPHALHAQTRDWPETNCFVDLWIEVLSALGLEPAASLGICATQDFEGDHFTFFKMPFADLETLYGLSIRELAIYDTVESHVIEQVRRGRMPMVEMDAFHLPDTRGVSYGLEHSKTTIGINVIDPEGRRLSYFHNAGYFTLEGDDYDGVFRRRQTQDRKETVLFPYAEYVKFDGTPLAGDGLVGAARGLLEKHVAAIPRENPFCHFARRIDAQAMAVSERDPDFFHKYAFNTLRQAGANFELLGSHITWLEGNGALDNTGIPELCQRISSHMKAQQFQLARAIARKRSGGLAEQLAPGIALWDELASALRTCCG